MVHVELWCVVVHVPDRHAYFRHTAELWAAPVTHHHLHVHSHHFNHLSKPHLKNNLNHLVDRFPWNTPRTSQKNLLFYVISVIIVANVDDAPLIPDLEVNLLKIMKSIIDWKGCSKYLEMFKYDSYDDFRTIIITLHYIYTFYTPPSHTTPTITLTVMGLHKIITCSSVAHW